MVWGACPCCIFDVTYVKLFIDASLFTVASSKELMSSYTSSVQGDGSAGGELSSPNLISALPTYNFASVNDFEVPQSTYVGFEQQFEGANQLLWSRRQEYNIDLPAPITPSLTSRYLHQSASYQLCN